jgi:hypothetical protein
VSHWRFSSGHGVEDRPLEVALTESLTEELPWDPARFSVSPYAYVSRGDYASALRPWHERFGDRLRVQFLADVRADAGAVLDLFSWLDLAPPEQLAVPPVNDSPGEEPDLPPDLLERLREHFEPSDEALRELLGRSLPWDPERMR